MVINEERMNCVDEIKKELKCMGESKRKWWPLSKNRNDAN